MRREKFDFVVGIGSACIASQALRDAGLQYASYPFDESYPAVKEKYDRRIGRLYASIRRSKRVLLVWLENPTDDDRPSDAEVQEARRDLARSWLDYLLVRIQVKICRHLEKRLRRRGVALAEGR